MTPPSTPPVDTLERVDPTHTPKNLLIRALLRGRVRDRGALAPIRARCDALGISPRLLARLGEASPHSHMPSKPHWPEQHCARPASKPNAWVTEVHSPRSTPIASNRSSEGFTHENDAARVDSCE